MPRTSTILDQDVTIGYGGGLNTSSTEDAIKNGESAKGGKNYEIDAYALELRPRQPFDLLDTAPDGYQIRGMINRVATDGTAEILVQTSGGNVYKYDGALNGFDVTPVATGISSTAKLRGKLEHNWNLTDEVIVTDLNLQEHVKVWDGSSLSDITDGLAGNFKAKYAFIALDRAWYANIEDNGSLYPHLIVGSEVEDYNTITTTDKPSTAIGEADPFYMTAPDLRPINGLVSAFSNVVMSTKDGQIFVLSGSDSTDFAFSDLFPRSGASGYEGVVYSGNDVVYGRRGRIESLSSTNTYGDVQSDDLSKWIKNEITDYKDWVIIYNSRTQKIHFFDTDKSTMWTFSKPVYDEGNFSPWVPYETTHSLAFRPSCVMNMIDPDDGLEYVYMGDDNGNFYRLEGTRGQGDGGTDSIQVSHVSGLVTLPKDRKMSEFTGYVKYKKGRAYDIDITFQYAGDTASDASSLLKITRAVGAAYYGGSYYYSDDNYYGLQFSGRLLRKLFSQSGDGKDVQIKTTIETENDFQIREIGFRLYAGN